MITKCKPHPYLNSDEQFYNNLVLLALLPCSSFFSPKTDVRVKLFHSHFSLFFFFTPILNSPLLHLTLFNFINSNLIPKLQNNNNPRIILINITVNHIIKYNTPHTQQ